MHGDLEIGVSLSRLQAQVDTLYYCEVLYNIRQSSQALNCYQMQVHMSNIQGDQSITKCQSLEQRKVYCRTKQWDKWLVWKKPRISREVSAKHFKGFLGGIVVKNLPANTGDTRNLGLIPGLGRAPEGGNGNPFLPGKCHGQSSLAGYSSWGSQSQTRLNSLSMRQQGCRVWDQVTHDSLIGWWWGHKAVSQGSTQGSTSGILMLQETMRSCSSGS